MKTDKEMAEYVMNHYSKDKRDILCLARHLKRWREEHARSVDLNPSGVLTINGTAGVTGDGFTKGIKTSESGFDDHVATLYMNLANGGF